jgi:predicted nucleic acid-binding protein
VRLVADANVLLSAVIGGRAALALRHNDVEQVLTPITAYDEVFEYLPSLAKKKRLDFDTLLLACAALPVTVVERSDYQHRLATARRRIGKRDRDDVDVLALALVRPLDAPTRTRPRKAAGAREPGRRSKSVWPGAPAGVE